MTAELHADVAIVGGGLAGSLIALAYAARRPEVRVLLIEGGDRLGGNHVWSFFDTDLSAQARALVAPLVTWRWDAGHDVFFPGYERTLRAPYNSIASAGLDAHVRAVLGARAMTGCIATQLRPDRVLLADGRSIAAEGVIDARGPERELFFHCRGTDREFAGLPARDLTDYLPLGRYDVIDPASSDAGSFFAPRPGKPAFSCGWQKFVGQRLALAAPHGLTRPVIMDATVDQTDGYRFVYVLPTGPQEVFVEDTYYTDGPELDVAELRRRIGDYAAARGWPVEAVVHEETGVLPVTKGGRFAVLWPKGDAVARAGVAAGLFHPTTGYSLPFAAELALTLADEGLADGAALAARTRAIAARHWRAGGYYRMLGRMLFDAAPPRARYRIFERFYRLPEPLVARFYAGRSSAADKIRILCGKPPVPISAAMQAILRRKQA